MIPRLDEGHLQHVLGVGVRFDRGFCKREDLLMVQLIELCKALAVAALRGNDQNFGAPLQFGFLVGLRCVRLLRLFGLLLTDRRTAAAAKAGVRQELSSAFDTESGGLNRLRFRRFSASSTEPFSVFQLVSAISAFHFVSNLPVGCTFASVLYYIDAANGNPV